jgi:RNA polymerase sigma-70 factor (ECF subfamily)
MTEKKETSLQTILTTAHLNYEKKLNIHAFFKLQDHALGEDLVQDAFIKTWKYLVRGGKIEIMRAFLYHILNDLIIDEYRKHKTSSLNALMEKGFEPKSNMGSSERLFNILDGKAMILLIKQLPEKYEKIMRMRYIQELSIEEMSLITGQSKNSITVQAHRGLEKLKSIYKFT